MLFRKILSVLLLAMLCLVGYTGIEYINTQDSKEEFLPMELAILELVNGIRRENGLHELTYDVRAESVARSKTREMYVYNYFEHSSPVKGTITQQFEEFGNIILGENAWSVGENLAKTEDYGKEDLTADFFVRIWMQSEGHRANILNKDYTAVGIAVYWNRGVCYAAQEFLREEP
ncbi:MAG: CAP domain-containing protein [Christensenellales bacterium]